MTLDQIKEAIANGERVFWASKAYEVLLVKSGNYLIVCHNNDDAIGLTWQDGVTMNGKPEQFFIG